MSDSTTAWRPIADYPNYEVSDDGRVRSLPRERVRGGILKPSRNVRGYWYVGLFRNGKCTRLRIHKLVAEAFIGPCPPGQEVRHLNDIKDDNRPTNLAYGTRLENKADEKRNGVRRRPQHVPPGRSGRGPRTHCRRDHALTPENVYVGPDGKRRCRTCGNDRFARRDERVKAARRARKVSA